MLKFLKQSNAFKQNNSAMNCVLNGDEIKTNNIQDNVQPYRQVPSFILAFFTAMAVIIFSPSDDINNPIPTITPASAQSILGTINTGKLINRSQFSLHLNNNQAIDTSNKVSSNNRIPNSKNQTFQFVPSSSDNELEGMFVNPHTSKALTVINNYGRYFITAINLDNQNTNQKFKVTQGSSVNTIILSPKFNSQLALTIKQQKLNELITLTPIRRGDPSQQFYTGDINFQNELNRGAPFWPVPDSEITQVPGGGFSHRNNSAWDFGTGGKRNPILAVYGGIVESVDYDPNGGGNMLIIKTTNNKTNLYMHMHQIDVKKGQIIPAGKRVGLVGTTGHSTGEHLHLEFREADGYTRDWKTANNMPWRKGQEK